jgi:diguanylate cyclase (GGDEF)-like protein/putative nucleotidyltransferase with HDIG domain
MRLPSVMEAARVQAAGLPVRFSGRAGTCLARESPAGDPSHVTDQTLSTSARLYVGVVIVAGFAAATHSAHGVFTGHLGHGWLLLAFLTVCSSSFIIKLPSVPASISVSEVFIFTCFLVYGRDAGVLTAALDGLAISILIGVRQPYRILFNSGALATSVWLSGQLVAVMFGFQPLSHGAVPLVQILLPALLFTVSHFLVNSWLLAFAISAEKRTSARKVWSGHFLWLSLNYIWGASLGILLVHGTSELSLPALAAVVPLLGTMYLTFRTVLARVSDADKHVEEVNNLYLCTIETLAMAVDAKDQTTHGHIRRVQTCAVGLARALGITEHREIKALEAAALLHDMGKLAVPEHILNKPGKLTPAELEKMKVHATVGADILSAVDFPYPVVPIVRHHHENWDGSGYPAGLAGGEIPIGARILSVVDCFDALTSHRPYRPALSDEDALAILRERRGTMYDPMIVDKFFEVHASITPREATPGTPRAVLIEITRSSQEPFSPSGEPARPGLPAFDSPVSRSADQILAFSDVLRSLAGQATLADTADVVCRRLLELVPATICAIYLHDPVGDDLRVAHSAGEGADLFADLRIPVGQRLSGWVAANRHPIVNSDPALDLCERAAASSTRLRSALSMPLVVHGRLIGVLTFYATTPECFTDEHRRIVTMLGRQVAAAIATAVDHDHARSASLRDPLTGLPNAGQLAAFVTSLEASTDDLAYPLTVLTIGVNAGSGVAPQDRDEALRQLAHVARCCLRGSDLLFRSGSTEFAVLLMQTDLGFASAIASRLVMQARSVRYQTLEGTTVRPALRIGAATAPQDSRSPGELLGLARTRELAVGTYEPEPIDETVSDPAALEGSPERMAELNLAIETSWRRAPLRIM